jgi:hypothetical protein
MRINVAVPESHVSAPVLNAALEATTRLNESLLKSGEVPLFDEVRNSIRWRPEPPGDEHFDHAGVVVGRKWGDCDDMAPFAAATMRHTGEDPGATAVVVRSGPERWHAIVRRSDGTYRDPSRETGMGQTNGIVGAGLPLMAAGFGHRRGVHGTFIQRPMLALRPVVVGGVLEAWQARSDLPWHWQPGNSPDDVAMVSLHASPVSSQAIAGACRGIVRLGAASGAPEEALARASAVADYCDGAAWEDVADEYGEDEATAAGMIVGSFFGDLAKKAAPLLSATPFAPVVATFGGRGVASRMVPQGGGAQQMPIMQMKEFLQQNPQFAPMAQQLLPLAGTMFAGPLGAMGGNMLAQFVTPQQAAFASASPELQSNLQQGLFMPPPTQGGGMPFAGMIPGLF